MIKQKIEEIIKKYWDDGDECYSGYYYDEDNNEFNIETEIKHMLMKSNFEYNIETIEAFDSSGYSCDVLTIAWIENGKLSTYNILLEYM